MKWFFAHLTVGIVLLHAADAREFTQRFPVPSGPSSAVEIIGKVANDHFVKCGDSWFMGAFNKTVREWYFWEYKGTFKIGVWPRQISQADGLNGLSWYYDVQIYLYGARREHNRFGNQRWTAWQDSSGNMELQFVVKEEKGIVLLRLGRVEIPVVSYSKEISFECSQIPKQ